MQKIILISIVLLGLVVLFGPEAVPDDFQLPEILDSTRNSDVIIIFNSGGWGNTPPENAEDFTPIIEGIQKTLNDWGYKSVVIPYTRTKNDFLGKITAIREFFNRFEHSSDNLADKIETLGESFPDKKIIIAGLSSGGTFVNKTYEKISGEMKDSVLAITAGTPFWTENQDSDNILQLDNNGKDTLAIGDADSLFLSLFETPFKWIKAKISGKNLSFWKAFHASGHDYYWPSPEVSPKIITFLYAKIR
ncbi:MAG: hypothetical protein PHE52_01135 [Candidatus Pacebacteria bacterium]|nr:hypothetical protein [Candidatus Paceibacterota bacterium]